MSDWNHRAEIEYSRGDEELTVTALMRWRRNLRGRDEYLEPWDLLAFELTAKNEKGEEVAVTREDERAIKELLSPPSL